MTSLPYAIRDKLFRPSTSEGVVKLITIDRPGVWAAPLRFSDHAGETFSLDPLRQGVTHQGEDYVYAILSAPRPDDIPGEPAEIPDMRLENVEQDIGHLTDAPVNDLQVTLTHVALSDPDIVIEAFPAFAVAGCEADSDAGSVALDLKRDTGDNEPETTIAYTPDMFGGLFR